MAEIQGPTLRTALLDFFSERECPHFGTVFIRWYKTLPDGERLLDTPLSAPPRHQGIVSILAGLPIGRALAPRDFGERTEGDSIASLHDSVVGVLNRCEWETGRVIATSIAAHGLNAMPKTMLAKRIRLALGNMAFPFDCAGIVRAARLFAKARGYDEVYAPDIATTCLLLLPKAAWLSIKNSIGIGSAEYSLLEQLYTEGRELIDSATNGNARLLWSAAIFARDELVPLPRSGHLADVRPADGIRIEWPDAQFVLLPDPTVDGLPVIGADTIANSVLLPTAKSRGLNLPPANQPVPTLVLHECVGVGVADGGWAKVLERTAAKLGSPIYIDAVAKLFPAATPLVVLTKHPVRCPACDTPDTASSATTPAPPTQWTFADYRPGPADVSRAALAYHMCDACGYTATVARWTAEDEPLKLEPDMRHQLMERTKLLHAAISEPDDVFERVMILTEAEYITLEVLQESPLQLGYSALKASWAALDARDLEAARYWRRHAVRHLQAALTSFGLVTPQEEATVAYLTGELWRLLGDTAQAHEWFDRVPEIVDRTQCNNDTLKFARQQRFAPCDLIWVAADAQLPLELKQSDIRRAPGARSKALGDT